MKRAILIVGLLVMGLAFAVPEQILAKEIQWKAQTLFGPEDAGTIHAAGGIVDATNAALKGKLKTTLFNSGALVPPEQMYPALSRGVYDAAYMVSMMRFAAGSVAFGLPFAWENVDQVMDFYYDFGFLEFMRNIDKKNNIFFGCPMPFGSVSLFSKFPVHKLEDFKGKKIWAEGPTAELVKSLGGNPVWFDPGDVYMGLKLGTIDGVFWGFAELETLKIKEVVDYIMLPAPISPLVLDWVINLKSWNALDSKVQAEYEKVMKENVVKFYEKIEVANNKGLAAAKAYGVKVINLEPGEFDRMKQKALAVWETTAAKDKDSKAAVSLLKQYIQSRDKQ